MSVLNSADSMMSIATTEAQAAGLVLQPAIMIGFQFKLSTGKAANIDKARDIILTGRARITENPSASSSGRLTGNRPSSRAPLSFRAQRGILPVA